MYFDSLHKHVSITELTVVVLISISLGISSFFQIGSVLLLYQSPPLFFVSEVPCGADILKFFCGTNVAQWSGILSIKVICQSQT